MEMREAGLIKSLGVSNFLPHHLDTMIPKIKEVPVVNQIEIHPLYIEEDTIKCCENYGITLVAYAPLATYDDRLMKNEYVIKLAEKYTK